MVCNEIETDSCYTLTNAPDAEPKDMKKKIRSASLCDLSSLRISFYKDNNDKLFRTHKLNVAKSCDAKLP